MNISSIVQEKLQGVRIRFSNVSRGRTAKNSMEPIIKILAMAALASGITRPFGLLQSAFCAMHFAFLKNVGNANCNVRNALCIGAKKKYSFKIYTPE